MTINRILTAAAVAVGLTAASTAAWSATEIRWWHAHSGRLGEVVDQIAKNYNASQSTYKIVATYKGGYEDTMTAGIAAFRAKKQPHIIQIFDAGAATFINAPGALYPVADLLDKYGVGSRPRVPAKEQTSCEMPSIKQPSPAKV